ncbi:uncharacterized protein LOC102716900 [Oryza brachyantha]|uniref:DRBM domain-containing protein n=1 Tax=Oryza brachyantha TaxID=4533 RepID=J3MWM0_ORYBR|nr:uncharacterized protein LOC102716900 [Oryza brachyantha]
MKCKPIEPFQSFAGLSGENFTSYRHHSEAEQNDTSTTREYTCAEFNEALRLINQETLPCKDILDEFAMRANITEPCYFTVKLHDICSSFISSVLADGRKYMGERGATVQEANESAARAAIKSILAARNHHMLESVRSYRPTIQGQQSGQTSAHPEVAFAATTADYIPCPPQYMVHTVPFVPHDQTQWRHPGTAAHMAPVLPHEQMQWCHPTAVHMPLVIPHQQMQWHQPPARMPFLPQGEMQWRDPAATHMQFLPADEQISWNSLAAHASSEMWQLPQAMARVNPIVQDGLYNSSVAQDDDMIVEVGSYEEDVALSGTKRKMDQAGEPEGKHARTSQ